MILSGLIASLCCLGALIHSYFVYPWHMRRKARQCKEFDPIETLPHVFVLMAARNEEALIQHKIQSIFRSTYPKARLQVLVGTDACTDRTDSILDACAATYPGRLHHRIFSERCGKPGIVGTLYLECRDLVGRLTPEEQQQSILVLTDVDAIFEDKTLAELVLPFGEPSIGGVQAQVMPLTAPAETSATGELPAGDRGSSSVLEQEIRYLRTEMATKAGESYYGAVVGGYGALMAMRFHLFEPAPKGLIVDDFYWFGLILQGNHRVVFAPLAKARMPVEASAKIQFRRKRRLGKGNLQNLWIFRSMLFRKEVAYFFWSHKVLRWLSPWWIIAGYLTGSMALVPLFQGWFLQGRPDWTAYATALGTGPVLVLVLYLLDQVLRLGGFSPKPLRLILHFLHMNLALWLGAWDLFTQSRRQSWWDNQPARS